MNKLAIALIVATIVVIALVMYFLIKQGMAKAQSLVNPTIGPGGVLQCPITTNIITYVSPTPVNTYTYTYTNVLTQIPTTTYVCPQ